MIDPFVLTPFEHLPETDDPAPGDDGLCHLLDEQGRAFCFADVGGREPHKRDILIRNGEVFDFAVCTSCRRETCPRCNRIRAELERRA